MHVRIVVREKWSTYGPASTGKTELMNLLLQLAGREKVTKTYTTQTL